jgi:hypothetical protein
VTHLSPGIFQIGSPEKLSRPNINAWHNIVGIRFCLTKKYPLILSFLNSAKTPVCDLNTKCLILKYYPDDNTSFIRQTPAEFSSLPSFIICVS